VDTLVRFLRKLGILIRREKFNNELEEEMAFHREQTEKEFHTGGMASASAQHAAKRQFGNATRLKEQSHEVVGFRLESVLHDLRFALRQLVKNPGFACTAILILALGIGASVAFFAFVDAALLKPLPYLNPARLVGVYEHTLLCPLCNLSYFDYLDWKKDNKAFASFDVWNSTGFLLKTPAGVQPALGTRVSGGFFHTLGVSPVLGRDFHANEDTPGGPHTVLLSYSTWQKRYSGRQDVIGQTITLNDISYTVIGVLPREFQFALRGGAEFWTTIHDPNSCEKRRGCHNLYGIARLKEGVSVQAALADMTSIANQLALQYPVSNNGQGAAVLSLSEAIVGDIRPILLVLLSGAGLLLLIASINVASLLLVRSESRKREMAVRGALGASPARLIRQFVTEGLVLVMAGSLLGVAAAYVVMQLILKLVPVNMLAGMPYLQGLGLHSHVVIFAGAISLLAAVLFSITPALRLSFSDLREDLAEGGRGTAGTLWRRFGANFVVLELATAVVLLVGAGLLGKSFYRLLHVDLNFQPDHLATLEVAVPRVGYEKDEQIVALGRQISSQISSLPGVKSAGLTSMLPATCHCNTTWFRVLGHPWHGEHNDSPERDVSSDYFTTLQAKLLRGRYFTETDDASKPGIVIINQALAKKYFPDEDPIGKKIGNLELSPKSLTEIVGVVDDIREGALDSEIDPVVYYPFNQSPDNYFNIVVRTSQDEASLLPVLVNTVHKIDSNIGVREEITMTQRIGESQTAYLHRASAWLVGGFAGLALLLSVVGLYGVIAYSVSQRTREIGVRMALGAQRSSVYQLILKEAGWLTVVGVAAGLICSVFATTLMQKLLFGVRSWDVATLASVAALLVISALLASFIPARRAASVNPVEALRAE